jgi:hypothetical protein
MHSRTVGFNHRNPYSPAFLLSSSGAGLTVMKFILLISNAFINTMGITQPSPETEKRAAWFIVALLAAVLATIATIAILAIHWASRH